MTVHEMIMIGAFGVVVTLILWTLIRRTRDKQDPIDLRDLLLGEDGKISKAAAVMHGSFIVTTWVIVFQTLNKTLTDTTFGLYVAAWVAPAVTRLIKTPIVPGAPSSSP